VHDQVGIVDSRREPSFRLARRFTLFWATDRKKAKKRQLTEGMTEKTLTDLTVVTFIDKPISKYSNKRKRLRTIRY
jgi:hypothetical protein